MGEGGLHRDTDREKLKPKPGLPWGQQCRFSTSPLRREAASAESIPRLHTSGRACQSARQGAKGGRGLTT